MTKKKYPVESTTKEKIKKLFAFRRITDVLKESGLNKDKEFVDHLIDIQYQIYMLDAYLESKWEINKTELEVYWEAIAISLQQAGFRKKQISYMVTDIKLYQKIESNCRKGKWPTRISFKEFYTAKSCDVRLIRHIIYKACPDVNKIWKEDDWNYYDIITEIHDDIADIEEDIDTYNGNRFLISILRKGMDETRVKYERFLTELNSKAEKYFEEKMEKGKNRRLAEWIAFRSNETLKMLNTKTHSKTVDRLSKSLILSRMK